ncbi:MAG: LamG-like jellyroll fold domain-containing protein [Patescibacteria group bacterium]
MKRKILLGILIAAAMTTGLLFAHATSAQTTDQITVDDLGLSYGEETGLSNTDIRLTIARIIRVALGLLGIVALVLILYGGFVWMTAGGDEEKIQKAKKILVNAVIGLIIILSAYAIASFVINTLVKATGGGNGDEGTTTTGGGFASTLYITSMPGNDFGCGLRNLHPVIVFSRPIDLATVENNLVIHVKDDPSPANGAWHFVSPTRQDSIVFDPVGDCGVEGQTDCLAASTTYQISFLHAENIKSQTGSLSLKCVGEYKNSCANNPAVEFTTGVGVDTEPPTVNITSPNDGESLAQGSSVTVEIEYTDNYGLQNLSLFADDNRIKTMPISGCKKSGSAVINWPTGSTATGVHAITAVASDNASLTASTTRNIKLIPAHCFDDVQDPDEDEVGPPACGANSECGHCGGGSCNENSDCASGFCDGGVCVDRMKIEGFSPTKGAASSTYVTIWGKYFGNDGGHVYFTSDDGDWTEAFVVNCGAGVDNWTTSQLVVKVPKNAATGPIRVETASTTGLDGIVRQFSDTTDADGWGVNQPFTVNSERLPGLCALVPNYGAPYSDTILLGENFGSDSDKVLFGSSTSYIKSWANKSITARVPALGKGNATAQVSVDGNLSNVLRYNVRESLNDDTPIIESITPDHGAKGEYITITGKNFGNYQGTIWFKLNGAGTAKIGDTNFPDECDGATWSDSRIIIKFPAEDVTVGEIYSVQVMRSLDSAVSPLSGINFDLESGDPAPGICAINPVSGPVPLANSSTMQIYGEYYTRNGEAMPYFWQTSASATTTEGRTPAASVVNESDTVAELYPSNYAETGPVVMHRSADDKIGNDLPFTVYNCLENNNKCSADGYKCCTKGADAGVCKLEADLCAGETRSTGYIWRFNTGPFPPSAQVVERCNAATDQGDNLPSPSPSIQWTSDGNTDQYNVCRSALVNVIFSMKMKASTVNADNIKIYPCNSIPSTSTLGTSINTCEHDVYTVSLQPSSYNLFTASGDETGTNEYISLAPVGDNWEDNTYYQVVLSDDIMSTSTSYYYGDEIRYLDEQNLKATRSCGDGTAYCFVFRTGSDDCKLSKVIIAPYKYWTAILEAPMKYRAIKDDADDAGSTLYYKGNGLSDQHCIMMNMNNFEWRWSANGYHAAIYGTPTGTRYNMTQVAALANTVAVGIPNDAVPISGIASSTVDTTVKTGNSPLTIDLSHPKVVDYWPKCLEACTNAEVAARFNILMSQHNLKDGSVKLDICRDENCTVLENVAIDPRLSESDSRSIIIPLSSGADLATSTIYQVTISKTGTSTADQTGQLWSAASSTNSSLYSRPMQTKFVWRFKTKSEKCVMDNVQIMPALYSAVYLHDRKVYSAEARSAPDTCDPKGQKLNTWAINWQWESSSTSVATVQSFSTHGQNPACTSNCLKKGSDIAYGEAVESLCGNGRLEAGEDCDPPASTSPNGLSCTLDCLRPGNTSSTCGNGIVESVYGEECEPNISASNGCGTNCLFAGSKDSTGAEEVGASICGNGYVGLGEDCDLGIASDYLNPFSSLNCSANCLHVGTSLSSNWCAANTTSFAGFLRSEYLAVCTEAKSQCGDGVVSPGEDANCETMDSDDPVDDGCTINCLADSLSLAKCAPTSSITVSSASTTEEISLSSLPIVGWWKFDEGSGSTISDASGHGHAGTLMGAATYVDGMVGSAIHLNGIDNFIEISDPTSFPGGLSERSICAWGKTDSLSTDFAWILSYGTGAKNKAMFIGRRGTTVNGGGYSNDVTDPGYWASGVWHHICLTYDGSTATLYGDGVLISAQPKAWDIVPYRAYIGAQIHATLNQFWMGAVDEAQIFSKALTPDEVLTVYQYGVDGGTAIVPGDTMTIESAGEGCNEIGQYEGSSLSYSTSSVCGDEVVGIGEDPDCETGFVVTHTLVDPWALVVGVGLGTPTGEPPAQITDIKGTGQQTIGANTYTDSGKAQFRIKCGYTKDSECKAIDSTYGLADNSCCYEMATLISTYPKKSTSPVYDICPNTYIEAKFNRLIDQNTLANGVFIARGYAAGTKCSSLGGIDVTSLLNLALSDSPNGGVLNWFANIWHHVIGWVKNIFGNTASAARTNYEAEVFCAMSDYGRATVVTDMAMGKYTTSTVMINLNTALATNTDYAVILSHDVRDALGISIGSTTHWRFITADEICTLNNVAINPSEYMYNTAGESVNFVASSTAANGQMIQPVFGYAWEYEWGPAVNDIATLTDTTSSVNLVTAKNRNGEIVLTATADITQNIIGAPDVSLSGQSDVTVFLCENPWPSSSASDFPFYDEDYDFSTYYCRDYGSPGFADDLPYVTTTFFDASIASSNYAKRYIFTNTDNKDAIGMQIFYNPDHLSVSDWYANEGFSGGVGSLKIDGYEALGSTYNYYIDALKTQTDTDNHIYPNIYQYSINNDVTGETSEVFKQMMNNLKFNKNIRNEAFCADDLNGSDINYSMSCSSDMDCLSFAEAANKSNPAVNNNNYICMNLRDKLQRDYVRLKDLRKIVGNLTYGQGLIGAWSMDAINSYGRVADISGHGMDGIVMGGGISITTGTIGNAMHLVQPYYAYSDGHQRSYLKLAQSTAIGDRSFTVGQWVKTTSNASEVAFISNTAGSHLSVNGFRFGMAAGQLMVRFGNSGGNSGSTGQYICSNASVNDGSWHHVVAVFERDVANSSKVYCYVDDVLQSDKILSFSSSYYGMTGISGANAVRIGIPSYHGDMYNSSEPFVADYDDVRIYGRALSEDEISAWYAGNLPITDVSYPKMADNTYLTGQAISVWPSAWSALGSAMGFTLPTDPINKLAQSGTCYLPNSAGGYNACYKDSDCAVISTFGRVSYFSADKGDVADEGTLQNAGSIVGAVGTDTGKGHGKAFSFSGDSTANVSVPHNNAYNSDKFTVSAWIYPTKKNTATIIKKGGTDDNGNSLGGFALEYSGLQYDSSAQMHFNNGTIRLAVFPSSTSTYKYFAIDSANPITVNAWHHIVAVFDKSAGTGAIYIDGVLAGDTFRTPTGVAAPIDDVAAAAFNNLNLEIGASFNGLIDNVAFYTRVIGATEAANLRKGLCVLHDATTGWSAEDRRFSFACNTSSYAYRYSYVSSTASFLLRAKLEPFSVEEPINWGSFQKAYVGNWVNFSTGVCATDDEIASPYNVSCGDGVLGGTEACDPPGKKTYDTSACPSGSVSVNVCTNQCKWASTSTVTCRSVAGGSCGDGKVQSMAGETCDDGALNGMRGRCNATCNGIYESCGDGLLEATEFCDSVVSSGVEKCTYRSGVSANVETLPEPIYYFLIDFSGSMLDTWSGKTRMQYVKDQLANVGYAFANPDTPAKIGIGVFSNENTVCLSQTPPRHLHEYLSTGFYSGLAVSTTVNNANFSAVLGCGTWTGDGVYWFRNTILPLIMSDENNAGRPINLVIVTDGQESSSEHKAIDQIPLLAEDGVLTYVLGVGSFVSTFNTWAAAGDTDEYIPISSATNLASVILSTYYTRPCREYSFYNGYSCAWDCNGFGGYCGDGTVNGTETCEVDQACTTGGKTGVNKCVDCQLQGCEETTATVSGPCGDGTVDEDEACDRNDENGIVCTVEYPRKNCTYCSSDCKNVVTVDATCGNGLLDTAIGEVCDPEGSAAGHARTRYQWDAATKLWLPFVGDYCYSCNSTCTGWDYTSTNSAGSVCAPYVGYCGDGIVQKIPPLSADWEQCERGDVSNCDDCGTGKVNICSSNCICACIPTVLISL